MQTEKLLTVEKATPRPRWPMRCIAAAALIGVGGTLLAGTGSLPSIHSRHTGNCPGSAAAYELSHDFFGGGGDSFFDEAQWQYFTLPDPTGGPTSYLSHADALESGLLEEGDGWAVLRGGTRDASDASNPLRRSVRIHSRDAWDGREQGFLLEVGYTHVPHGCGVWPALWMYCDGSDLADAADGRCEPWPQNGEIDLLEFANEFFSKTSLHFGADAQCRLNATAVEECGPFLDKNGMDFDCATEYFPAATDSLFPVPWAGPRYGCAPNRYDAWPTPREINSAPGTFVFEWSSKAMKVWNFPRSAVPADLTAGSPEPSRWDVGRMWSYYPLQGCPTAREQLRPLNLVINIAYCGDWAGGDWERQFDDGWVGRGFLFNWMQQLLGESCASKWGDFGGERSGGVGKLTQSGARQACNAFINAQESDAGVTEEAYFNFTRLRVYTARGAARR